MIAENVFDKCETKGQLTVDPKTPKSKPIFTQILVDKEVIELESYVEFVAKTDSQMIFDEERNTYELVIKSETEETIGKIKCTATNTSGTSETSAKFNVIKKPKFIKHLESIEANGGDTVSMTVRIKGTPELEVKFTKDGIDVSTEATIVVRREIDDIYILQIKNVRIIMSGEYQCRIKNKAGEAFSNGTVIVYSKPKIVKDLEDKEAKVNEYIVLEVVFTGNPTPKVSWIKDGVDLIPNDRITINNVDQEYSLEIKAIAKDDVAQYICKAVNKHGEARSVCLLKFQDTPHSPIVKKELPKTLTVEEGTQLLLTTQVDGQPLPSTQWLKDGKPLKQSDDVKIIDKADGTTSLIVKNVSPQDSGVYEVKAINMNGEIVTSSEVKVEKPQIKPLFEKELPKQISLEEGKPLCLSAKIEAKPAPDINWTKNGNPIRISDNVVIDQKPDGTLNISSTKQKDSGVYVIRASNTTGQISCSTEVHISGPKMAPVLEKKITKRG